MAPCLIKMVHDDKMKPLRDETKVDLSRKDQLFISERIDADGS